MKKMTMLRSIATLAFLVVVGMNLSAQVTGTGIMVPTGAAPQDVDYVTINSTIPYQVTAYDWAGLSSVMQSAFQWTVSADGTISKQDGSALSTIGATGYASDNAVGIKWTNTGSKTISLTEIGQVISTGNLTSCAGTPVTLTVNVLPRPVITWNAAGADPSGCGLATAIIPVHYTDGSKTITVTYDVYYTALATGSPRTKVNAIALTATLNTTAGAYDLSENNAFTYTVANGGGKYEIQITNITDLVTSKSFSVGGYTALAAELPATTYTFYSYPTPTTAPIQHIQNL
jgi:hypothetical protein